MRHLLKQWFRNDLMGIPHQGHLIALFSGDAGFLCHIFSGLDHGV
ncbi:hypothetical protein, partial [Yoonia sp.]